LQEVGGVFPGAPAATSWGKKKGQALSFEKMIAHYNGWS
jgi:hypothetical protein